MKPEPLPYRSIFSRRDRLFNLVRPVLEWCGIDWLSRPGLNGLDRQLERLLPRRGGWFVEAGAYDGFQQSNTYYFAKLKGWRGVLIEPLPQLARRCQLRRKESTVVCCALGAPENAGGTLRLRHAGLMTMVCGALADDATELTRASNGLQGQGLPPLEQFVEAPVRTLTEILIESQTPTCFDLLSLDVEGFEVEVLKGFDMERHQARFICLEVRRSHLDEVLQRLSSRYELIETLHENTVHGDYLFRLR